jgi:succinate-semialdehyde dehydrogenase/glutarate-semialdehyde dehydrogenase
MAIESINPATGERLEIYQEMPRTTVDDIIGKTHETFLDWQRTSFKGRAQRMRSAAAAPLSRRQEGAVRRRREVNQPHETGVVSRAQFLILVAATAPQASRNTYLTGTHTNAARQHGRNGLNAEITL